MDAFLVMFMFAAFALGFVIGGFRRGCSASFSAAYFSVAVVVGAVGITLLIIVNLLVIESTLAGLFRASMWVIGVAAWAQIGLLAGRRAFNR